jgi:hypothetical protein
VGALVVASPGAAWSATAEEEAGVTWSVSPSSEAGPDGRRFVELDVDPGTSATEYAAVRNFSETPVTFSLTAADGYYTDTGRFNMLPASETSVDAGAWITLDPDVTIGPGQTAVVPYTITVPENATPGDHAAGVAASVRSAGTDESGNAVGVDSRVGFRVSLRVSGELTPALAVGDVRAEYVPSWSLFQPGSARISYTATNDGNTVLSVTDRIGDATAERGSLLPGESRTVTVDAIAAWPVFVVPIDLQVDGTVPDSELAAAPFTQTVVLWAIPWLYLLAALGIALILFAIFTGRRRNKRRMQRLLAEAREEGRRQSTEAVPAP